MYHIIRWTPEKIKQRLDLIAPLVYIQRHNLPSFRYKELAGPNTPPPIELHIDDSAWEEISANLECGSGFDPLKYQTLSDRNSAGEVQII